MNEEKLTPIEALNEFYKLKDKYEKTYYEKYVRPIVRSKKSKLEKRQEFSKLPKNECINCKRNVGTIFQIKNDDYDLVRKFMAKCGDLNDPCPLNIQINMGQRELFNNSINEGLNEINKIKTNIIKEKNNAIFFNKDVVSIFETLTNELKEESERTGFLIETNLLRNENPEKYELLRKTIDEFGMGFLLPFKQMIKDYNETNNELVLNRALKFYVDEMVPKLKEITEMKYDVSMIEFDEVNGIYKLLQMPISLQRQEFFIKSDDKTINFIKGVKNIGRNKTTKNVIATNKKKTTLKNKKNETIILSSDESEGTSSGTILN